MFYYSKYVNYSSQRHDSVIISCLIKKLAVNLMYRFFSSAITKTIPFSIHTIAENLSYEKREYLELQYVR